MMAAYNCAKAGVDALTRTCAREGGWEEGVVAGAARERAIAPLNPACVFDIPNQE
jgi:NAD(P)-dependent dehydrogenase (short-subunit alcohol dehydrogenase family)